MYDTVRRSSTVEEGFQGPFWKMDLEKLGNCFSVQLKLLIVKSIYKYLQLPRLNEVGCIRYKYGILLIYNT